LPAPADLSIGVALYGPPASGKDTITRTLTELDHRYVHYLRLKAGSGRTDGYRSCTNEQIDALRDRGLIVYENVRYGSRYAVDRPALDALFAQGLTPVVHIGQLDGVHALLRYPARWLVVLLQCRRKTAEHRARERGSADVAARLRAWDDTKRDLANARPDEFGVRIDTDRSSPADAARAIDAQVRRMYAPGVSAERP
jgi:guanylate kinase